MEWIYLFLAIGLEIISTTLMKVSYGFSKLWPSIGTVVGYILCFTCLSLSLKKLDVSIAYAIWSAVGITIIAGIGVFVFKESMNWVKVMSLLFIIIGVIGLNLSGVSR